MEDSLGAGSRGALTKAARKRILIGIWVSVPILGFAIAAMISRGISAASSGDNVTALSIFISGIVVGLLVLAVGLSTVIYLMWRSRRTAHRFEVLRAAYPDSLAFVLDYPTLKVSSPLPGWSGIKASSVHGIAVNGPELVLVRITDVVEALVGVRDANCEVSLGTREVSRSQMVQVEFVAHSGEMTVEIGVLLVNVRRFSNPAFGSLAELVSGVRSEMAGADRPSGD
ncbi:hypothetical protein BH11ACT5_BH11ACT5_17560 [soil metagenome]